MKAILDRKKSALTVITASQRWAASAAAAVADFLRPVLAEGETMPDVELLQKLFGRALALRWESLEAAGEAEVSATARRNRSLAERAGAVAALYRRVVDLRSLMRGLFGAAASRRLLGIAGRTSTDPVVLLRQAGHVVARLLAARQPPAAFEPGERDRGCWAAPVAAAARALGSSNDQASKATKELEAAAADRLRATGDFNAAFVLVAGWLAGTYVAAGREGWAELVRPSRRRLGILLKDERRPLAPPAIEGPGSTHSRVEKTDSSTAPDPLREASPAPVAAMRIGRTA